MTAMRRFLASAVCALAAAGSYAQVVAVEQLEKGFLIRSEPTLIWIRESPAARAVLMYVPGGVGRIGLTPETKIDPDAPVRGPVQNMLRALADPARTSGMFHTVMIDSPYDLPANESLRAARDHLTRLESVLTYLRDKYKLPVWVMGHSSGGYSLAEFVKRMQQRKKEDMIGGIVFSAGRYDSSFGRAARFPALFISSDKDGCQFTRHGDNRRMYERFKAGNAHATEFVPVAGGAEGNGNPCESGFHMYNQAWMEVAEAIEAFAQRHTPKN
jgi:hypothetical protein